jgi:hypothetical protein
MFLGRTFYLSSMKNGTALVGYLPQNEGGLMVVGGVHVVIRQPMSSFHCQSKCAPLLCCAGRIQAVTEVVTDV